MSVYCFCIDSYGLFHEELILPVLMSAFVFLTRIKVSLVVDLSYFVICISISNHSVIEHCFTYLEMESMSHKRN